MADLQVVKVDGTRSAELNGQLGHLLGPDPEKPGRMHVQLLISSKIISVTQDKLQAQPQHFRHPGHSSAFAVTQVVQITGTSRPEFNGKFGQVVGPSETPGKVKVKFLHDQTVISVGSDKMQIVDTSASTTATKHEEPKTSKALEEFLLRAFKGRILDEATMVLLGPTGSGKSSLLNFLANFPKIFQYGNDTSLEAMYDSRNLNFENSADGHRVSQAESQTSAATMYEFPLNSFTLKIVDTPGFGDTRGHEFDKAHAKMIVDCIKNLEHIHAIVLVVSGRQCRATAELKYVLTEICAILPSKARQNIMVVFTNTASPLYLSFDVDVLSSLVEQRVEHDKQVFIENPYVLLERSYLNKGKVCDKETRKALLKAFQDASENMEKFFSAVGAMPRLNTKDFERLYTLRTEIESSTITILNQMECASQEQKRLAKQQRELEACENLVKLNENFTQTFSGVRWVFVPAEEHGTFCGEPNCRSNCHAPCVMERTLDNERFKRCCAFYYTHKTVTLKSAQERDELLTKFSEEEVKFLRNQDKEDSGSQGAKILKANATFSFGGNTFEDGAMLQCGACTDVGFSNRSQLQGVRSFPAKVVVSDTSDQDTCNECGHSRSVHYHDMKKWVEEPYTEQTVDSEMQQRFHDATNEKEKKEIALKSIQEKIAENQKKQDELGVALLKKIREFETHGMSRNYALLLQNQRDLLEQHINAAVEGEDGTDVKALKQALAQIETQLAVVQRTLKDNKTLSKVEWARLMLGVGAKDSLAKCEKQWKQLAARLHPDKFGGNPERMQQVNKAIEILREADTYWGRMKQGCKDIFGTK
jgi:GTP-binding protein EngB required for normal cell division